MSRANRKEMILETEHMKEMFMSVIRRSKKRYRFNLLNFCILGNHFHFLIEPDQGESLSKIMQWILSRFATLYNKAINSTGHVWGGRYWSRIICDEQDFKNVMNYIDNNPIMAALAVRPGEWKYCGLYHIFNGMFDMVSRVKNWTYHSFRHEESPPVPLPQVT